MIQHKVKIDGYIKDKLEGLSLNSYLAVHDFESALNEIGNEINNSDLPLELKEKLEVYLHSSNLAEISNELYSFYQEEKESLKLESFWQGHKKLILTLGLILVVTMISLLVRKFTASGLSFKGQLIHAFIAFPICAFLYFKCNSHNKENNKVISDLDYRFRNKIFIKIDDYIKDAYEEENNENRSKVL